MEYPNGVTTKDHLEAIIMRLEESLKSQEKRFEATLLAQDSRRAAELKAQESFMKEQITELRLDIKHMQTNFVSRNEHQSAIAYLQSDIERIQENNRALVERYRDEFRTHIEEGEKDMARMIAIAAIVAGFLIGLAQLVAGFYM